jgi:PII-like signaling protein
METLYALVAFNLASTIFTLVEVIRLENAINNVFESITEVNNEEVEEDSSNKLRTFS